ncbi:ribonuclease III [Anaerolineales bacterium HSG6]|nr:ribonuclease III [Anaerolineales bacterium HSG6]
MKDAEPFSSEVRSSSEVFEKTAHNLINNVPSLISLYVCIQADELLLIMDEIPVIDIVEAEIALNLNFSNKALLQRALTHRSYINETPDYPLEDNERLEFLGDAVLDFVTAEYLYHRYPELPEGRLTNLRSALVRTERLAQFASDMNLGSYLLLGRGEAESGGRNRMALLCDAYEALIGAMYLDNGIEVTSQFIQTTIEPALEEVIATNADKDAKSMLQELSQSHCHLTPTYRTVQETGPDHAKEFTVEALVGEKAYGRGLGLSKQTAAQAAAERALANLHQEIDELARQKAVVEAEQKAEMMIQETVEFVETELEALDVEYGDEIAIQPEEVVESSEAEEIGESSEAEEIGESSEAEEIGESEDTEFRSEY